jgi:hypothetical protein
MPDASGVLRPSTVRISPERVANHAKASGERGRGPGGPDLRQVLARCRTRGRPLRGASSSRRSSLDIYIRMATAIGSSRGCSSSSAPTPSSRRCSRRLVVRPTRYFGSQEGAVRSGWAGADAVTSPDIKIHRTLRMRCGTHLAHIRPSEVGRDLRNRELATTRPRDGYRERSS